MRQQTDTGEHFSRGDALPIQIVALHATFRPDDVGLAPRR